ncbi:hypothetical protein HDU67_005920 [Dinochytrium kinnereticum]|nr:hypothetical protein HDU67_005920 [Dinochytrium kinnereticum]
MLDPSPVLKEGWKSIHSGYTGTVVGFADGGVGVRVGAVSVGIVGREVVAREVFEECGGVEGFEAIVDGLMVRMEGGDKAFVVEGVEGRKSEEVEVEIIREGKEDEKTTLPNLPPILNPTHRALSPSTPSLRVRHIQTHDPKSLDLSDLHHLPLDSCTLLPFQPLNISNDPTLFEKSGNVAGYQISVMKEVGPGEGIGEWVKRVVEGREADCGEWCSNRYMDIFGIKLSKAPCHLPGRAVPIHPKETLCSLRFTKHPKDASGTPHRGVEVVQRAGEVKAAGRKLVKWAVLNLDPMLGRREVEDFVREVSRTAATVSLHLPLSPFPPTISPFWTFSATIPRSKDPTLPTLPSLAESFQRHLTLTDRPFTSDWSKTWIQNALTECPNAEFLLVLLASEDQVSHDCVKGVAEERKRGAVRMPTQCVLGRRISGSFVTRSGWVKTMVGQVKTKFERFWEEEEKEALPGAVEEGQDVMVIGVATKIEVHLPSVRTRESKSQDNSTSTLSVLNGLNL